MSLLQYTRLIIATCLLSVGLSSQAAVVHIVDNGQLIGATGVEVGGALYDVAFTDGTFDSLYPIGIPAFHDTEAEAVLFSQALLDSVFIDLGTASTAFDTNHLLTAGCDFIDYCSAVTPFESDGTRIVVTSAEQDGFSVDDLDVFGLRQSGASGADITFAIFTPVMAVPEPSTYAMLAAGLLMLAGFSRRSNRV